MELRKKLHNKKKQKHQKHISIAQIGGGDYSLRVGGTLLGGSVPAHSIEYPVAAAVAVLVAIKI